MIQNKKQAYIVVGVFIAVLALFTTTYAFFNYTRTGSSNVIKTGRIVFNTEQGQSINLTNMFPIDVSQGIPNDNTKVGTVTIHVTGDTTYTEGMEYLVTAVNVTNTVGNKSLPISIDVSVTSNTNNDPATTLGTADADYFTNRGPSASTSIYKKLAEDTITNNGDILVGYIKSGATGVDGNIVIKAYIDEAKVVISDTYPEENEDTNNDGYIDGTPTSFGEGKTVLTTTEWNSLQQNGVSFQIKVESQEGTWVEGPTEPMCRRVTHESDLHTTICERTNGTYNGCGASIGNGNLIKYGNAKAIGSPLESGDALDCDVNGNGEIDKDLNGKSTERFYYISSVYDVNTNSFDDTKAVLLYYGNVSNDGTNITVPVQNDYAYATKEDINALGYDVSNYDNWHGPATAYKQLPTATQWSNRQIILPTANRQIKNQNGDTAINNGSYIIQPFTYGTAARLLTTQELISGCQGISPLADYTIGEIDECTYLMENLGWYEKESGTRIASYWLETPHSPNPYQAYSVVSSLRYVSGQDVTATLVGVRPAIEVLKSNIEN